MQRRTLAVAALGAVTGALLAVAALALAGSLVMEAGVDLIVLDSASGRGRPAFEVTEGAMNALIVTVGALGGALLGALGYVVGREADPESLRFRPVPLTLVGAVAGIVVGFATARAGIGVAGSIEGDTVTLSIFRAVMVALIAGAGTGAVVGSTIERLSRPEVLGFAGEAWPSSPAAFLKEVATAMGLPVVALAIGIGAVFGFARALLDSPREVGLGLFAGASALVLAVAAYAAAHPPRMPGSEESPPPE